MTTRATQLNRIGRAHVAPNMSLTRWQAILSSHGINVKVTDAWEKVGDGVARVYEEIRAIVEGGIE